MLKGSLREGTADVCWWETLVLKSPGQFCERLQETRVVNKLHLAADYQAASSGTAHGVP